MKIMVIGIGGVGGYLASVLCAKHEQDVTLVARGARGESLKKDGLVLHSVWIGEHVYHPSVVEQAQDAGVQDVIFICVKNYSFEQVLESVKPIVGPNTIIVPVLNGVEHENDVHKVLPNVTVVSSAIYIVSAYNPDFSIKHMSNFARIFLGSKNEKALDTVYELLNTEGFKCHKTEDVRSEEWKKFILNCAYNVTTAYYEGTIGDVFDKPNGKAEFKALLEESYAVGKALGVNLPEDTVDTINTRVLNQENKNVGSSFARDVLAHRPNELETFSGYVVRTAKALGVAVPVSERIYNELKARLS